MPFLALGRHKTTFVISNGLSQNTMEAQNGQIIQLWCWLSQWPVASCNCKTTRLPDPRYLQLFNINSGGRVEEPPHVPALLVLLAA